MSPLEAMKRGIFNRIPFVSGTVKNEGAVFTGLLKNLKETVNSDDWQRVGPKYLNIKSDVEREVTKEQSQLANIIRQYYSSNSSTEEYPDQSIKNMFTDSGFIVPDQITVQTMSEYNP